MFGSPCRRLAPVALGLALLTSTASAQAGPPPEVRAAVEALEQALDSRSDSALTAFIAARFAPAYRAAMPAAAHLARLKAIRNELGGMFAGSMVMRDGDGLLVTIMGAKEVKIRMVLDGNAMVTKLVSADDPAARPAPTIWADATWDNVVAKLRTAEAGGWSGTAILRRDGTEVARLALGMADPALQRKTMLNTVYCIGSQPMDFTITAVMLLGQRGRLRLDDPISSVFADVPADKRAITIRHLLDRTSGLPDFFGDSTDWDQDLAYIDRPTAVRRILASKLEFAPGSSSSGSHAAFVLLAALVEQVSGKSYPDFVRSEILTPLGMTRTGFYGETLGLTQADFAVGAGPSHVGLPNIPPNWGPTSWLIMGSGGMISTVEDMDRYYAALESGKLLNGEWAKRQQGVRSGAGGSDRGFFIFEASNGRGSRILFLMNGEGRSRETRELTAAVQRLVGR